MGSSIHRVLGMNNDGRKVVFKVEPFPLPQIGDEICPFKNYITPVDYGDKSHRHPNLPIRITFYFMVTEEFWWLWQRVRQASFSFYLPTIISPSPSLSLSIYIYILRSNPEPWFLVRSPILLHFLSSSSSKPHTMTRKKMFACFRGGECHGASNTDESSTVEASGTADETPGMGSGGAVVVELFSSQGCATSPEAELVVSRIGKGGNGEDESTGRKRAAAVIVLSFHVDYWDYTGWKDPFGRSQWTVRQKAYVEAFNLDTMFTPQVVIQGKAHCVGNDEEALLSGIAAAPRSPAPSFKATFERTSAECLQVCLSGTVVLRSPSSSSSSNGNGIIDIVVALYENGLVTKCSGGANEGKILGGDFVVRGLEKLCSIKDIAPKKEAVTGTISFKLWEGFNSIKCGLALFLQNQPHHHIIAATTFKLPDSLARPLAT